MGRPGYQYDETDCTGGINGQLDKATPNQCYEAVNVWAPDGVVSQRPGYIGLFSIIDGATTAAVGQRYTYGATTVAANLTVSNAKALAAGVAREYVYMGYNNFGANDPVVPTLFIVYPTAQANSNATTAFLEYYSATGWRYLPSAVNGGSSQFLYSGGTYYSFVLPGDTTAVTINGTTYNYGFRWALTGANIDASCVLSGVDIAGFHANTTYNYGLTGVHVGQRLAGKVYIAPTTLTSKSTGVVTLSTVDFSSLQAEDFSSVSFGTISSPHLPSTFAFVPQYDEALIAISNKIYSKVGSNTLAAFTNESDPIVLEEFEGVSLLGGPPAASFIEFYRGVLWAAGLEENAQQIRWSAPAGATTKGYNVWPVLNYEVLIDNDTSPITGIKGYGQNMTVFKANSIYEMIYVATSDDGRELYGAEKRVPGTGSVSQGSIQEVNGHLFFLAEDGVFAYNGNTSVLNLGVDKNTGVDRIKHIIKRISPSQRAWAQGVHWAQDHCYLLSVALDGAQYNNAVLVYDYENDAWWQWDMEAQFWVLDEDTAGNPKLYFTNRYGQLHQMFVNNDDHGAAIESYVVTRKMVSSKGTVRARTVEIESTNTAREVSIEIVPNTAPFGASLGQTSTIDFTDAAEVEYNDGTYSVSKYTLQRDRQRDRGVLLNGKSFLVKVTHDEQGAPFELGAVRVGAIPIGKR